MGFPTIRSGDHGPAVVDLLRRLRDAGYASADMLPAGSVEDEPRFGEREERLVVAFQRDRRLRPDGVVGPDTWQALIEASWRLGDRILYERRPGLRGDDVAELQSGLAALGFDVGKIDGIYGPLARRAVEEFQRNCGLRPDGIAGPTTLRALRRVSGAPAGRPNLAVRERLNVRTKGAGLAGRRIFVDPRPGSGNTQLDMVDLLEMDLTYAVALALAAELRACSAHPMLSRGPDDSPTPSDRASTANWFGADIIISLGIAETDEVVVRHFGTHRWESPAGASLARHLGASVAASLDAKLLPSLPSTDPLLRETRAIAALVRVPVVGRDYELLAKDLAISLRKGVEDFLIDEQADGTPGQELG